MGNLYRVGGPPRRFLMLQAAKVSLLLSLLFLGVYNSANWITSLRTDVGTWYFSWELAIPFVPLMIIPYMSIDLFFIAGPFLCRDEGELRTLARRISFSILVAGTFFLLMPLRTVFPREPVGGWLGLIFDTFRSVDQPHNLFPSLHITLCCLLARFYADHTRGLVKLVSDCWFALIALSTVLTYQHQVVDIAGGFLLAGFAFYLFREHGGRMAVTPNRRVGCYYGAGCVAVLLLGAAFWPWGAFLLWPASALAIVAAGYFGIGPGIYRKTGGRLPASTQFMMAPVLIGQHLSLWFYRRHCRAWDMVAPGIIIGRRLNNAEAAAAIEQGVTAVLDLTAEFSEAAPFLAVRYRNLPILDLTAPTREQLREAAAFIAEESTKGIVYVHCKIGYSRSAAAIGAYLLSSGAAASVLDALIQIREARPSLIVRGEILEALRDFAPQKARLELYARETPSKIEITTADTKSTAAA